MYSIAKLCVWCYCLIIAQSLALNIVTRADWNARAPKKVTKLEVNPPSYVFIHHTATPPCADLAKCKQRVASIQRYHMDNKHWDDIGYNFLIGEDGNVYEGRGWGVAGAHAVGYNSKSIGISMIGTFQNQLPNEKALSALKLLINYGLETNQISTDYKLEGHRQVSATECPGTRLYQLVKTMDHWSPTP